MGDHSRRFIASPACYAVLYPALVAVARSKGYALSVHGSMTRDFDLIAVPWVPEAAEAEELIMALKAECGGVFTTVYMDEICSTTKQATAKPHGRRCWSIHLTEQGAAGPYLDISVMPKH